MHRPSWIAATLALLVASHGSSPAQEQGPREDTLEVKLGPGPSLAPPSRLERSPALPLAPDEVKRLLERLPLLASEPAPATERPEDAPPPPRTGERVADAFPPPESVAAPVASAAALTIVRRAPEGEVRVATRLAITFSQPMVAVESVAELASASVPARITPEVAGRWSWLGTRTLVFQPQPRFPMATRFVVELAAGTTSATGCRLEQPVRFEFSTTAPAIKQAWPNVAATTVDPLLFLELDQRIDPAAVLARMSALDRGEPRVLRLATVEEVAADERVQALGGAAEAGCWLALRATAPLTSSVQVTIGAGTPSAEGPRRTEEPRLWSFDVPPRFAVATVRPAPAEIAPVESDWVIGFTTELAREGQVKDVRVEPALAGLRATVEYARNATGTDYSCHLVIAGDRVPHTKYRVTVPGSFADRHGQRLGHDVPFEFDVGARGRRLTTPTGFFALSPDSPRRLPIDTMNVSSLRVRVYRVTPDDWERASPCLAAGDVPSLPAPALATTLVPEAEPDAPAETSLDLAPFLEDGLGELLVVIESAADRPEDVERRVAWVESTRIGLDAFIDGDSVTAWATSLADGKALSGVEVSIGPAGPRATTGDDGLARLALPERPPGVEPVLVARRGRDRAILRARVHVTDEVVRSDERRGFFRADDRKPSDRWFVFDDRHLYRPGEVVHLKGWRRRVTPGKTADLELPPVGEKVPYWVTDDTNARIAEGEASVGALGGFDVEVALPHRMANGTCAFLIRTGPEPEDFQAYDNFEVQEYRRAAFEVSSEASEGPHFLGEPLLFSVQAKYYTGGPLTDAKVFWHLEHWWSAFRPPHHDDFEMSAESSPFPHEPWPWSWSDVDSRESQTDSTGSDRLRVDLGTVRLPVPETIYVESSVSDGEASSATARALVHPAAVYVGLRPERRSVRVGEPCQVDVLVVDLDGRPIPGSAVELTLSRVEPAYERDGRETHWKGTEAVVEQRSLVSGAEPVRVAFPLAREGAYRLVARTHDAQGRLNASRIHLFAGEGGVPAPIAPGEPFLKLSLDRRVYDPGETARLVVTTPFFPAEGVLALARGGLVRTEHFTLDGPSTTLAVPVADVDAPNVEARVVVVGRAPAASGPASGEIAFPGPAVAVESISIEVSRRSRALSVRATPRAAVLEPGAETVIDVDVRDAQGKPVSGEVAVAVVDEAVLALAPEWMPQLPDPIDALYWRHDGSVRDVHGREDMLVLSPDGARGPAARQWPRVRRRPDERIPQGTGVEAREPTAKQPASERRDFSPLAVFVPAAPVDERGHAEVKVTLPGSLTRYRVIAVAASGARLFGSSGSATITARKALMLRPAPPRFLDFGDRFELPVVVENATDAAIQVEVAGRASNLQLLGGDGQSVTVPAHDRALLSFPAAAVLPGTARVQLVASAGELSDAVELLLPVWPAASSESFATYGELDSGSVVQPVRPPAGAIPELGGLELTASSTALQELTNAVVYLFGYPFACSEQLASRILAVVALRDVLSAFAVEGLPPPADMVAAVRRDMDLLRARQNRDGGFGLWRQDDDSCPSPAFTPPTRWRGPPPGARRGPRALRVSRTTSWRPTGPCSRMRRATCAISGRPGSRCPSALRSA